MKQSVRDIDVYGQARPGARRLQRAVRTATARSPTTAASAPRCRRSSTSRPTARAIILCSHLGRPDGKVVEKLRLTPVADRLSQLLGQPVQTTTDCVGTQVEAAASALQPREVLLLENLRFHAEEEKNDPAFARRAGLAGRRLRQRRLRHGAPRPRLDGGRRGVSAGRRGLPHAQGDRGAGQRARQPGAAHGSDPRRRQDQLEARRHHATCCQRSIACCSAAAWPRRSSRRAASTSAIRWSRTTMLETPRATSWPTPSSRGVPLLLPTDVVVADAFEADAEYQTVSGQRHPARLAHHGHRPRLRSTPSATRCEDCKTVFWNGPLGVAEFPAFAEGSLCPGAWRWRTWTRASSSAAAKRRRWSSRPACTTATRTSRPAAAPRSSSSRARRCPGVAALLDK